MVSKTTKIIQAPEVTLDQLRDASLARDVAMMNQQQQAAQQFDNDEFDEKDDTDLLNDVLSELGGASDVKVNVYLSESGKGLAFVGSYPPDLFSIDAIQSSYGAGEYSVHVRANGKIVSKRTVRIAKPRDVPINATNGLELISKQIADSQAAMLETIRTIADANKTPVKTSLELLTELKMMKEVMGGGEKSGLDMKDFLTMLEVAKGLVPAQGEASTMDVLMEGVKGIAPILAAGMQQQQQQQFLPPQVRQNPAPAANANSAPEIVPNPNATVDTSNMNAGTIVEHPIETQESIDMQLQERFFFNMLVSNAHNDNDPAPYAQMLLDTVGNEAAEKMLNQEGWFNELVQRDSRVQLYESWFTELRTEILEIIENDKNVLTGQSTSVINTENNVTGTTDNANAIIKPPVDGDVATNT